MGTCGTVAWELKRRDRQGSCVFVGNRFMANMFASNTNVQHVAGEDLKIAIAKYLAWYRNKDAVQEAKVLSTIRQVFEDVKKMERGANNTKNGTSFPLKRIINSLDKPVEFPAQIVVVSVLGHAYLLRPYALLVCFFDVYSLNGPKQVTLQAAVLRITGQNMMSRKVAMDRQLVQSTNNVPHQITMLLENTPR